ncbi:DUF1330 domain-containing protein [Rubritepida flocculans]|jgi:uncharacterized protein (DUF1330 family)|uniref:DUF1330 domain-containing protein n=1 Tax=Rubritepida flocculans TaxID=182403 RepID=UPI000408EB90|nr:DUF1330 domain-containing protein [Rubritepida flocculans]
MPAYLIAHLPVTDPARYQEHRAGVAPLVARFGGEFLMRGGAVTQKEGPPFDRLAIRRFPDMAAAEAFSHAPEYAGLLALRRVGGQPRPGGGGGPTEAQASARSASAM